MSSKRQKILNEALAETRNGEAGTPEAKGSELSHATKEPEIPSMSTLMEEVVQSENAKRALKKVLQNKGAPGVDGMTVDKLPAHLKQHWTTIRLQLLSGTYAPNAVKRVDIPKPGGGVRQLGIPTALDRFIQQAMLQILQKNWDETFSDCSFGFRPGRSAHQAVEQAQKYVGSGLRYVVDIDLEKFFDRVNHDVLMGLIAKRTNDKRILKTIRAYLNAGIMADGLVHARDEGTPQGGPLSPLLSNVMLDVLDKELERRGHKFVRYADDNNIYVASERAGKRVMQSITMFLARKLKLKVNAEKSAVDRPQKRKFLGFSFTYGKTPKRRIAPQAISRMKKKIRELTRKTKGQSLEQTAEQLQRYLTGWRGYFGFCETRSVLKLLDSWIRRRLRRLLWKQWKLSSRRFTELTKRGVSKNLAAQTVGSPHGDWHLSNSPALNIALSNDFFASLGIPTLA
ncbi:group II intron reverse transcriptase/maturase [Candidatus Obscuribacterales bacterium]|nr:group II intron reverse transcriptase/maturase [Candidatus Obscuribacterales bacterium]MBX3074708.1 group II intron reverse transcriptase/maturase [Candidatus Obscuribacterales bacterium]